MWEQGAGQGVQSPGGGTCVVCDLALLLQQIDNTFENCVLYFKCVYVQPQARLAAFIIGASLAATGFYIRCQ